MPPSVTFAHSETNDVDGFRGYEIYYKFYGSADAPTEFDGDRSAIEAAGPQSATAVLRQRGFYRVFALGGATSPAIRIDPSERAVSFDVSIQFQFTATGAPALATWNATGPVEQELVRDQTIFDSSEDEPGFSAADLKPDVHEDMPSSSQIDQPGSLDMGVVLLSYGIDFDIFSPIYSQPVVVDQLLGVSYQ